MANQPFNDLFVATFQIKSEVIAFLKNFVSTEISSNLDLDSLALDDNSYLTPQMDKFESDVVYNCTWKDNLPVKVSLLFEHKSSPPTRLALQLLRYMLEIWDKQIEQEQPLTIIIPIIVYHGEEGFRFKPLGEFFGEIADPILKKFIPNFDALLVNLTNYEDDQLLMMKLGLLQCMALLFKHKRDWDFVLLHHEILFSYTQETYEDFIIERFTKTVFTYLWAVNKPDEQNWQYLQEKIPSKIKDMAETMYDHIIEKGEKMGITKGVAQGLAQGEELKAKEVIVKLDKQFPNLTDNQIAAIVNMPLSFVKNVRAEAKKKKRGGTNRQA